MSLLSHWHHAASYGVWVDSCASKASFNQPYRKLRLASFTSSQSLLKFIWNHCLCSPPKWKTIRSTQQKFQWKLLEYEKATRGADAAVVAEFAVWPNCNHGKIPTALLSLDGDALMLGQRCDIILSAFTIHSLNWPHGPIVTTWNQARLEAI